MRVMGPRSTSTSSKVDHKAVAPQTKMVATFKASGDSRRNRCIGSKRQNTCCVCLGLGHQAKTCRGIVLPENKERTCAFLTKLVLNGKARNFLAAVKNDGHPKRLRRSSTCCALLRPAVRMFYSSTTQNEIDLFVKLRLLPSTG